MAFRARKQPDLTILNKGAAIQRPLEIREHAKQISQSILAALADRENQKPLDPRSDPAASEVASQLSAPDTQLLLDLLEQMDSHSASWPFLEPVSRDEVPDYYEVIKEPMDLFTMRLNLNGEIYPNPNEFVKDALLMFDNCRRYNGEATPYAKSANKLEEFMWRQIKDVPEWSHVAEDVGNDGWAYTMRSTRAD